MNEKDMQLLMKDIYKLLKALPNSGSRENFSACLGLCAIFAEELNLSKTQFKGFLEDLLKSYCIHRK